MDLGIFDIENTENILAKIFPQKENFPFINPEGRYLVKLKYLGYYYQIEVDDSFPVDFFT